MDLQLKGKVVIVTGGAKGIGAAIVRGCAAEGSIPVIVDRDAEAGRQLQQDLHKSGATCGLICVDLTDPESCSQSVNQTLEHFERIDALVNNAGRNDKVGLESGSVALKKPGSVYKAGIVASCHGNYWRRNLPLDYGQDI